MTTLTDEIRDRKRSFNQKRLRRMRSEYARRSLYDIQELVLDVLQDNEEGLEPNQIATELNIIIPVGQELYGNNRASIVWGILDGLVSEGLVGKSGSRAILPIYQQEQS